MDAKRYCFIGAGGIGMAALERYFLSRGKRVAGYDRTPSDLTSELQAEGAEITFDPSVEAIPEDMRHPEGTTVIYTPAVPETMPWMQYFRDNGFEMMKRAQALGIVTEGTQALCFAGTHGKTTTSGMAAHILRVCGVGCNAFLGGELINYGTNFMLAPTSPYSVVEADEYDRSFHWLKPTVAVITATDPDHLDIYGSEEAYLESFARFTELIKPGGTLIVHEGLRLKPRVSDGVQTFTYSRDGGDFHATYIRRTPGHITFDIVTPRGTIRNVNLGVPVEVNIENAIAAVAAVTVTQAFDPVSIREALSSYRGTKRRFELRYEEPGEQGRVIIDDYGHHPAEVAQSIASVKALYPGRRLTVAFQPHLYTRTRDFAAEFAAALSQADEVVMLPVYPARELPIPGVESEMILKDVKSDYKALTDKEKLADTLKSRNFDILLTLGAGDINTLIPRIIEKIRH